MAFLLSLPPQSQCRGFGKMTQSVSVADVSDEYQPDGQVLNLRYYYGERASIYEPRRAGRRQPPDSSSLRRWHDLRRIPGLTPPGSPGLWFRGSLFQNRREIKRKIAQLQNSRVGLVFVAHCLRPSDVDHAADDRRILAADIDQSKGDRSRGSRIRMGLGVERDLSEQGLHCSIRRG